MGDPLNEQAETMAALQQVVEAAGPYLDGLPQRLVYDRAAEPLLGELGGPLPEEGAGTKAAVEALLRVGTATATASAGPRFFHFVIGGSTPAALAADWVVSMLDQNAFVRASSRFADAAETVTLDWLRELVGLPPGWGGALTASATFANLTGLALATHWWAERHGVDVTSAGLAGLPRMPVLAGGYVHPSARKALQLLGHGKDTVEVFARDDIGRIDLAAVRRRLGELDGAPAVLIATAGEPNAGEFDPLADLADLAEEFGAWLHVDGAFGLFAALSPRTAHLTAGIERADSIAADAHKWLNVPVRERVRARPRTRPARPGVRHAGGGLPAGPGRPSRRLRPARPRVLPAGPRPADLGHPRRLRPRRLPRAGRAPLRPGRPPRGRRRRRPRPGTPGRGPPQRGLLPLPPARPVRTRARRHQPPPRRGPARRRPGVRRHHRLRWAGRAAPGDQQLAHHRRRPRPVRRGRSRAGRRRRQR